jgi:hypothetical protein
MVHTPASMNMGREIALLKGAKWRKQEGTRKSKAFTWDGSAQASWIIGGSIIEAYASLRKLASIS